MNTVILVIVLGFNSHASGGNYGSSTFPKNGAVRSS